MKVVAMAFAILAMPLNLFAGDELLFQTWNNHNNKWQNVFIRTNGAGDAEGIVVGKRFFPAADIKHPAGVNIPVDGIDRKVLTLRGPNVNPRTGGILSLEYLVNGVDNDTDFFTMSLKRDGDGKFKVYAQGQNKPMKYLYMYRNTVFYLGDKTVGIKKLEPKTATMYVNTDKERGVATLPGASHRNSKIVSEQVNRKPGLPEGAIATLSGPAPATHSTTKEQAI